jgi:hypothetical protein
MGSGQSVPNKLSRQDIYNLTKSTRDTMNVLLDYMLKEISIRDFYLLSNPNECKKYVLFLTNTLYKQFYELGIEVVKDKKSSLFFRPIKELVDTPESEKAERQSLCLILAYFYTRIFQIFGALALTLIDDANIMTSSGLLIDTTVDKRKLLAPGARPYVTMGGAGVDIGVLNFMRNYLDFTSTSEQFGYRVRSPNYPIYFKRDTSLIGSNFTSAFFTIFKKTNKPLFYLDIKVKSEDITNSKILVKFVDLRILKKDDFTESKVKFPSSLGNEITFQRTMSPTMPGTYSEYYVSGTTKSVSAFFEDLFSKLVPYVRSSLSSDYIYELDKPGYGSKTYFASDKDVIDELRLERTIHNLVRQKPLGHCIARALQLLNTTSLHSDHWESSVCKANFLVSKDSAIRSGLVKPGNTIDMSPGMTSLSQLFYDTIRYGLPKITMSQTSIIEYTEFMRKMATIYGDNKVGTETRSDSDLVEKGLKGIKNRRDMILCKDNTDKSISINKDNYDNIYQYVNQLYKIQLEHSKRAGAIFQLLFNIERDKSSGRFRITFNDNILKKGIPEINRINIAARKVLVQYYENCETTYLKGMAEVIKTTTPTPKPI